MKTVILDAQALFYMQKDPLPPKLEGLRQEIIDGNVTAIIPSIAISEVLWKMRRKGPEAFRDLTIAYEKWKVSPNIIIDSFDVTSLNLMFSNEASYEIHDEIIAMTCRKYETDLICSKDQKFKDFWKLSLLKW